MDKEQLSERFAARRAHMRHCAALSSANRHEPTRFDIELRHSPGEAIAGFNDSFTAWNFINSTWGAYSGIVNVAVKGVNVGNTGDILKCFPTPTDFAVWLSEQYEG